MRLLTIVLGVIAVAALTALGINLAGPKHHVVDGLGWIATAITLVVLLVPLTVRRYDRAALWWLSLKYRLKGSPSLPWNLSIRLRGDFTEPEFFDRAAARVGESAGRRFSVLQPRAVNGLKFTVDGMGLIELVLDDVDEYDATSVTVRITGLRVGAHEADKVLTREIVPVVKAIESAAGSGPLREESWALRVEMDPETNPYLGLYLRDRDPGDVLTFNVRLLADPAFPANTVAVDKTSLYLTAGTSEGFVMLVRDFVTFSGRGVAAPAHA